MAFDDKVAQVVEQLGPIDRLTHTAAIMPSMLERDRGEILVFGSIVGQAIVPSLVSGY